MEPTTETPSKEIKFRFVDEIVYPADRAMYYFTDQKEYISLLKEVNTEEAWININGWTYAEMTNGAVFILRKGN